MLWGDEHDITAVELDIPIAHAYKRFFPMDRVIIGNAHDYLAEHYHEYDFIWSSPPCTTHSVINVANKISPYKDNKKQIENGGGMVPRYPDMSLYQEIIFLGSNFKGKWCVENTFAYYEPLIKPNVFANHWFWCNFLIPHIETDGRFHDSKIGDLIKRKGFDKFDLSGLDKRKVLRNCVEPEVGKHILDYVVNPIQVQKKLL